MTDDNDVPEYGDPTPDNIDGYVYRGDYVFSFRDVDGRSRRFIDLSAVREELGLEDKQ